MPNARGNRRSRKTGRIIPPPRRAFTQFQILSVESQQDQLHVKVTFSRPIDADASDFQFFFGLLEGAGVGFPNPVATDDPAVWLFECGDNPNLVETWIVIKDVPSNDGSGVIVSQDGSELPTPAIGVVTHAELPVPAIVSVIPTDATHAVMTLNKDVNTISSAAGVTINGNAPTAAVKTTARTVTLTYDNGVLPGVTWYSDHTQITIAFVGGGTLIDQAGYTRTTNH